jgi:hypothetical protein
MANPTFVQAVDSAAYANKTVAITVTNAGDALVVVCAGPDSQTISDSKSNKYEAFYRSNSGNSNLNIYVALNCAAGATTITLTGTFVDCLMVAEYTNVALVRGVEFVGGQFSSSGSGPYSMTLGNIPTVNANDLIVGCFASEQNSQTYTAGSGFTLQHAYSTGTVHWTAIEDQLIASPGATATAITTDTSPSTAGGVALVLSSTSLPTVAVNTAKGVLGYGTHTSISSLALPTATGNGILVAVCSTYANLSISSVVDTTGTNVYTAVPSANAINASGNGCEIQFFLCPNATGNAANVVTANFTSAAGYVTITVWEVQSIQSPVAVDVVGVGHATSNAMATGSFTPLNSSDLIIVAGVDSVGDPNSHTYTPTYAGGSLGPIDFLLVTETAILLTPSAQTPGWGVSASTNWAEVAVALTGILATYTISGNTGVAGAKVSYTGTSSGSVIADGSGNYTISALVNGSYTLTPSLFSYVFSPTSSAQTVSGANITGVNFTPSTAPQYSISGNAGHAGTIVNYTGNAVGSVVADGSGNYSIPNLYPGNYCVIPLLSGYTFSPYSAVETVSSANITAVNFTAIAFVPNYGWAGQRLASDTFASGSLAAGWGVATGSYASQITSPAPYYAEPPDTSHASDNIWTGLTWPNDQTSELTIHALTAEAGSHIGLWVRVQSGALSGYELDLCNGTATLNSYTAGTPTSLASASGLTIAAGDVWTLQAAGASLIAYQNGTPIVRYADVTYTSGTPGFRQYSTVNVTHSQVASWRGYSVVQQDGIWQKQGIINPPIAADITAGAGGMGNAAVLFEGNAQILSGTVFKMLVGVGAPYGNANTIYAESYDCVNWTRYATPVLTGYAYPFIFKNGSTYYVYVEKTDLSGFVLFTSTDLINFSLPITLTGLTHVSWAFCPVAIISGTWYALAAYAVGPYDKNVLNLYTSSDGAAWTEYGGNPVLVNPTGGSIFPANSAMAKVGSTYYAWMFGNQPGQCINSQSNINPGEGIRYQTTDFIHWTNPVNSVHHGALYESVNNFNGEVWINGLVSANGQTYLINQSVPSDTATPHVYQISLATSPLSIAQIVAGREDGTTQTASDAFTSGAGNLSANWTTPTGLTKLQIVAGNLCEASATSTVCAQAYTGTTFSNDQYSEITIATLGQVTFPTVRMQTGAASYYGVAFNGMTAYGAAYLTKTVSGSTSQIGPLINITPAVGDVLRLSIVGNVISLYQNGYLIVQYEDFANSLTSGYPGLAINTASLAGVQVSLWAGGNADAIYSVSGSAGVAGATVSYSGPTSGSITADGSGNYTIPLLGNGTYTITPSKTGYSFSPTSASETVSNADISGVNFTATQNASGSSGLGFDFRFRF